MKHNKTLLFLLPVVALSLTSCQQKDTYVKPFESAKHSLIYRNGTLVGVSLASPDAPEIDKTTGKEMADAIIEYQRYCKDYLIDIVPDAGAVHLYVGVDNVWGRSASISEFNKATGYAHCIYFAMNKYKVEKYTYSDGDNVIVSHKKTNVNSSKTEGHYWIFNTKDASWSEHKETYNKLFQNNYEYASRDVTNINELSATNNPNHDTHYYSFDENHLRVDTSYNSSGGQHVNSVEYQNNLPCYWYDKSVYSYQTIESITFFDYNVHESRPDLLTYNNEIINPTVDIEECFGNL